MNNKDGHGINEHNPLKSSYDSQRLSNVTNDDANDCSERLFESVMNNQEEGMHIDDYNPMHSTDSNNSDIDYRFADFNNNVNDDSYDPNEQLSTAVSKVQIKLNNLINNHKASLKLYDDIVELFNDYISSPNFDVFATLKSRKSFMKSMETSYRTRPLRPMNTEVILHDGTRVNVPIFDAKAMILDLLTNPNTMNKITILLKGMMYLLEMWIQIISQTTNMVRFTQATSGCPHVTGFAIPLMTPIMTCQLD